MATDDFGARARRLSDDDTNEDEPLDLDVDETIYDDDDGLEMVEDEDEETEEELPPTMHITTAPPGEDEPEEEKEGDDKFGPIQETEEDTRFRESD